MKKYIYITILVIFAIIVFIAILFFKNKENINEELPIYIEEQKEEIKENTYVDDNIIKIGLYTKEGNTKKLSQSHTSSWKAENVMGIFYAVASNNEVISGNSYGAVWKDYWNKYENTQNYKIGYNISFSMGDKIIDKTILNPDDAYTMYPKLQLNLYDDINLIPGKPYYHVTSETMTENTIFTSVKIVGDTETKNITSPIKLTTFTYKDISDFDIETGKYRGNFSYTTIINKK